ncbi:MAG: hypothetical protein J7K35_06945 [Syntrophobacterales bacterium]|nr:hypothetical protein [Syntrophobacterales bacterium]
MAIQMPALIRSEKRAFNASFKRYSYLESSTPVPIAMWIFDFPVTFGKIDCNFNARIVCPKYIDDYLALEDGHVKNAITFYLLDGQILKGIKLVGLREEAVRLFHKTIRKQLSMEYTKAEYSRYLEAMYQYSTEELFRMGKIFKK